MKKSVIGTVMVAEVAMMLSVMAMNANSYRAESMTAQANQKQVSVEHSDKAQHANDGKTYQMVVAK